jgi:ATP-dependent Clp protease adapter protein ClpS
MTRTGVYKAVYFLVLGGSILLIGCGLYAVQEGHPVFGVVALVGLALLLLPGHIIRHYWVELQAGLYHLNQGNYAESKLHSERFLVQLQERPWLKKLIWLGTSSYSRDAEAMARNNLGGAMIKLGEIEPAREQLSLAIALDPLCPLPYLNMGALVLESATYAEAVPWVEKAEALGLKGGWPDSLVSASQHRNAMRALGATIIVAPPRAKPPLRFAGAFRVELLKDELTPFDFVISSLEQVFGFTGADAVSIAALADRNGRAGCAGFETEAAAQAKADQLSALAVAGGFPLSCAVVAVRSALS